VNEAGQGLSLRIPLNFLCGKMLWALRVLKAGNTKAQSRRKGHKGRKKEIQLFATS
jgi:hypothetical protein